MEPSSLNEAVSPKSLLRQSQQGLSALEFALVFPLFFLVLYMAIAYGLIFAAQQSMNYAAETMARDNLLLGKTHTDSTATINWLRHIGGETALELTTQASTDSTRPYETQIIIRYDYINHPIVPWLGPKVLGSVLFPKALVATATIDKQITGLVRP